MSKKVYTNGDYKKYLLFVRTFDTFKYFMGMVATNRQGFKVGFGVVVVVVGGGIVGQGWQSRVEGSKKWSEG